MTYGFTPVRSQPKVELPRMECSLRWRRGAGVGNGDAEPGHIALRSHSQALPSRGALPFPKPEMSEVPLHEGKTREWQWREQAAVESKGNNLKGCRDFDLKAKAEIWP